MIILKRQYSKILPFLLVDIYHFKLTFIHLLKKNMKHWNLDKIGYWVIGTGCQIKKDLEKVSVLKRSKDLCSKDFWKFFPLFIPISWPGLLTVWVVVQKIYSKMHPAFCTNTHQDVTDFLNYGLVKNTKTWISLKTEHNFSKK